MPSEKENREITRRVAFRITGVFEAPSYSTIQTIDSGIISYGQHQATLSSGTLGIILDIYCDSSDTGTAKELKFFLARVAAKDTALKNDAKFLNLLRAAGNEQVMKDAQDSIFIEKYWNPAIEKAVGEGIKSPLGFTAFYDTNVQGGLNSTIERVRTKLGNKSVSERDYLKTFLECRRERLLEIAQTQINSSDPTKKKNGEMLKNAAKNRIGSLINLVDAGNLELTGKFDINGKIIEGRVGGSISSILQQGDKSEAVGILQDNFIKLGYMSTVGVNRGTFGPKTEKAVKEFQADLGFSETGKFAGNEQKTLSNIFNGVGQTKQNSTITRKIQDALVKRGYMTATEIGNSHGTFGPKTAAAIKRFQGDNGILQTGELGPKTYKALFN